MASTLAFQRVPDSSVGDRSVEDIRSDFPILKRCIDGSGKSPHLLVYLDNAATTQKPKVVIDALSGFYNQYNANVHRSLHTLGEESTQAYEESRKAVCRFLNAREPEEIIFTRGTTEAINLVAYSWGRQALKPGDGILLTEMEHHSNLIPWQLVAAEKKAVIHFLPVDAEGRLPMEDLGRYWDDRIRLVAVTHVSNVFGTATDIGRLAEFAHSKNVPILIDAAQGVPHLPVDVQALSCDFLAFSGHKIYGPMGVGVLYGRRELLERMEPYQGGGEMIRAVWFDRATWNDVPYKFEAGTPNVAAAIGLKAALEYVSALGREKIRELEESLADYARGRLAEVPELSIIGPRRGGGPAISFVFPDLHPHDVAQILNCDGIAVRAGHHCAQPLMRKLGLSATVRASFSFYNTAQEIDLLVDALKKARTLFAQDKGRVLHATG